MISAAVSTGVKKLVFTSSSSVVFEGNDLSDVDERLPYSEKPVDAYTDSKAKAEIAVLEANGKGGLLTVALRPAAIFGLVLSLLVQHGSLICDQTRRSTAVYWDGWCLRTWSNTFPDWR